MINIDYVNGSICLETENIFRPYESFLESCENDINKMFADFEMLEEKVTLESAIMGSVPESMMMVYESEKKGIFTRIGEMVVTLYNKFIEVIDKIIDTVKSYSFKKKSDLQKLDILLKKHPELKDEAIAAFNKGALDLSDVRSLKELDSTFDEILKMAKKKDIDPKSLRGKWEKAKEKFEKDEKAWGVVKVAAATTAVIGAAVALKTLPAKFAQANNDLQEEKQKMNEKKANILAELKAAGEVTDDTGRWQTMLLIWRELHGKHTTVRKNNLSVIERLSNGVAHFLDKFDNGAGKRLQDDLKETKNKMDNAAKKAQEDAIQKVKDEAKARKAADREDYNDHRREELKKSRDDAYNKSEAQNASREKHRNN